MRALKLISYIFFSSLITINLLSCSDDNIVENPSGETIIYTLQIINGDLTEAGRYDGVVDQENKTVEFTIPAESNIEKITFSGKLSLGAKVEAASYSFLDNLTQTIKIVNVENSQEYTVKINLEEPKVIPFVDKMIITNSEGKDIDAYVSLTEKVIYLKSPHELEVTVKDIVSKPARAVKNLTALSDNKLKKDNPGRILLDFMGLKDEYEISFSNIPQYGANFEKALIYDFSQNPLGANIFPDFISENTRSADFDGENTLIVSREGGNEIKLLKAVDIIENNVSSPILLNKTGIAGGTYLISSGRLSQGHVYVCNLSTGLANTDAGKLKIYHWASPTSIPDVIVDFDGTVNGDKIAVGGRFGDNMSVNLDEAGNGHIFCVSQNGVQILRFTISEFTTVTEIKLINTPITADYYASYNKVDDSENEYVYTSTKAPILLVDKDGKELYKADAASFPLRGTDARIITFNSERYLIMTTGMAGAAEAQPTFYVYDLTAGFNTIAALSEFEKGDKTPLFTFSLGGIKSAAHTANTGWGIIDDKLYAFGAAPRAGFALFEFPEKE